MYTQINNRLNKLKSKINERKSLLNEYQITDQKIQSLAKSQENYSTILVLNEAQENLLSKLEENKKLNLLYERLIDEKESLITASESALSSELNQLNKNIKEKEQTNRGLSETLMAGRELQNEVSRLIRELGKAKGWGLGDIFGTGLFGKRAKHGHLREARAITSNIKRISSRYKSELKDIAIKEDLDLNVSNFIGFVDIFVGNLVTEWIVQFKIHFLLRKSKEFEQDIQKQIDSLERKEMKFDDEINALKLERVMKIENV